MGLSEFRREIACCLRLGQLADGYCVGIILLYELNHMGRQSQPCIRLAVRGEQRAGVGWHTDLFPEA